MRHAVQRDGAADDRGIAREAPLPQPVAEEGDAVVADLVLVLGERAADERRHPQHREQIGRHARPVQPLRLALAGQIEVGDGTQRGDVLEHVIARLEVVDVRHPDVRARQAALGRGAPDVHEPVRLAVRQRLQDDPVDDAEHRGGRADAERDGQRRGGGKAGRPPHQPHAVPQILHEGREQMHSSGLTAPLDDLDAAERAPRRIARRVRRHAGGNVLVHQVIEVGLQLFGKLTIDGARSGQRAQPEDEHLDPAHRSLRRCGPRA